MFTGIVQAIGEISRSETRAGDKRLSVRCPELDLSQAAPGDSVCVNGVCLTAVTLDASGFTADVSRETLVATTLGHMGVGRRVNLEPALTLATPLGGHLLSGHVDGVGQLIEVSDEARSLKLRIQIPGELRRYIARKGSIAIDGISLTVNDIDGDLVSLNIVPHTKQHTIIGDYRNGARVNIEVDLLARYLERLLTGSRHDQDHHAGSVSREFLGRHGFL